ncbi:MAG: MarR family transcriptional regulator [Dehalococcoidales bacterium]|nr:MarR family transcriptional regulator [Dehalococcoidales bacterium]
MGTVKIDKDYKLWIYIYQLRDNILKIRDNELSEYGISTAEAGTLYVIKAIGGKVTPSKIAKGIYRQHHTITAMLKRMEKKGLVTRNPDPENINTLIIRLTEKGETALKQANIRESLHDLMSIFSEDEKDMLLEHLSELRDNALRHTFDIQITPFR